jgi:hypothetical protein
MSILKNIADDGEMESVCRFVGKSTEINVKAKHKRVGRSGDFSKIRKTHNVTRVNSKDL